MQAREATKEFWAQASSPLVAVLHDDVVRADRLRQVLDRLRWRVVDVFPNVALEDLRPLQRDADLVAAPVHSARPETLDRVKLLATETNGSASVLALVLPGDVARCLEALRRSGVAGLLATDTSSSQIEFRLNGILELFPEPRQRERVSVLLPVDLRAGGISSRECAVSLSIAGMGVASRRPLEPNCEIEFDLQVSRAEPSMALRGRIIHCVQEATSIPPFRIGVYFLDPPADALRRFEAIIAAAN